jgi:predicted Zn-dependent protease
MGSFARHLLPPAFIGGVFFLILIVQSCVTETKEAGGEVKLTKAEKELVEAYQAELDIGRSMAGRLLQFYGSYGDEPLLNYINQVGTYVAGYGDHPDRRYSFAILDSEMVNAFACPGGYILVSIGAIRNASNEAELAMILGHEVAHVGHKHMFNTLQNMTQKKLEEEAAEADRLGLQEGATRSDVRKRIVPEETSETLATVARYVGASGGAALGALHAAKAGMSLILEKGLDKALEFEADREGTKYGIRAGYDPRALQQYLKRLEAKKKGVDTKVLDQTHPKLKDRRKEIATLLKEMNAREIVGAQGKERFVEQKRRLPEIK